MAIAFDTAVGGNFSNAVTQLSWNHTVTGADTILIVAFLISAGAGDIGTGATYNGVAMTLIDKLEFGPTNGYLYLFRLENPATGTHQVQCTTSASTSIEGASASYTGVKQTGQPDSSNKATFSGLTFSLSTTVVAPNCWLMGAAGCNGGGVTAGANTTIRTTPTGFPLYLADSNGNVATGSRSLAWTNAGDPEWNGVIASIAPAVNASAALTGTAIGGITEADVVAGGKTIIITLTGDTFIPA